jgi:hypothetical protein
MPTLRMSNPLIISIKIILMILDNRFFLLLKEIINNYYLFIYFNLFGLFLEIGLVYQALARAVMITDTLLKTKDI